jgi:hypothetical protein
MKPGGGSSQPSNVRTATLRLMDDVVRRRRGLGNDVMWAWRQASRQWKGRLPGALSQNDLAPAEGILRCPGAEAERRHPSADQQGPPAGQAVDGAQVICVSRPRPPRGFLVAACSVHDYTSWATSQSWSPGTKGGRPFFRTV